MMLCYNGVIMQDVGEVWTDDVKATLPYCTLVIGLGFILSDKPLAVTKEDGYTNLQTTEETQTSTCYQFSEGNWAVTDASTTAAGEAVFEAAGLAWASYDILDSSDGTVYMAAGQEPFTPMGDIYECKDGTWWKKTAILKEDGSWFRVAHEGFLKAELPIVYSPYYAYGNMHINLGTADSPQYAIHISPLQLTAREMERIVSDVFAIFVGGQVFMARTVQQIGSDVMAQRGDFVLYSNSGQGQFAQFPTGLWVIYAGGLKAFPAPLVYHAIRKITAAEEKFYLYNDHGAPVLPEVDPVAYPYMAIGEIPFDCFDQNLIVASAPPNGTTWEGVENLSYIIYENNGEEWVEKYRLDSGTGDDSIQFTNGKVTWCNTDTYDSAGELVTAASEPVPLLDDGSIYGVSWDMSSSPAMTRTDAAADFDDPVPSVGGAAGSSPFDSLMPWAGMKIVEDEVGGSFVSIPKFWYKITQTDTAFNIQIADYAADGFSVSPAHADRGDGKGERDTVYIARYKAGADYKSASGQAPLASITRATGRTNAAALGDGYSLQDYAMLWTTRMLMVVEYATWDMQAAIGYNCGNGSAAENTGATDSMPYHTGTVQESIETYGVGVQYRYIEDPWGNVMEWADGWRADDSKNIYINTNPATFSDTEGGTLVGTLTSSYGWITGWNVPTAEGLDWAMTPTFGSGSGTKYVADDCGCIGPALGVGGAWDQNRYYGPFCMGSDAAFCAYASVGARLQKIP